MRPSTSATSSPVRDLSARADPAAVIGIDEVRERLAGRVSVLVGHSGVGKSTLVNAARARRERAVGVVNDVTGRGRHTSTSAVALPLPDGDGWVIDTPGIRSFGLAHVDPARIITYFPDLERRHGGLPSGVHPRRGGVRARRLGGLRGSRPAGPSRLDSLRRLLRARFGTPDAPDVTDDPSSAEAY